MEMSIRIARAFALARSGAAARAVTAADEMAAEPRLPIVVVYNVACVYALAITGLPPAEAEAAAAKAMSVLRRAVAAGFRNGAHMIKDPDLTAIRGRPDFAELLWNLADFAPQAPRTGTKP
jgi:hypothetical protein